MARSKDTKRDVKPATLSPEQGAAALRDVLSKGRALLTSRPLTYDNYSSWELIARNYLEKAFGSDSPNVGSIVDVGKYGFFSMESTEADFEHDRVNNLNTQLTRLEGLVELLDSEARLTSATAPSPEKTTGPGHKVFLVHGHDERVLHEMARFLEKLDQQTIVLREQPNQGRTIIEKFEQYSDVGFAVVLLTPDDKGGKVNDPPESLRARARQNVILELGYFLGKLGRNRVCAVFRSGVEIPSDYSGVIYLEFDDNGAWRLAVAREMKAAGLHVDLNKAF